MAKWEQVGGDVNPKEHGAVLARVEGTSVTVVDIEPIDDNVGGIKGYYVIEGDFDEDDLAWGGSAKAESIASYIGCSKAEWKELNLAERAAAALSYHGSGWSQGQADRVLKWSEALPAASNSIKWWRR